MKRISRMRGSVLVLAAAQILALSGCSLVPRIHHKLPGNRAFVEYWPPKAEGLRLAVKDNIDMQGIVTTAGSELFLKTHAPAKSDAPLLANARQRGVQIVGKTNLTEFAVAPSGFNEYFGTPRNPYNHWRKLIPGGSSSGSAVAVASGMADVAIGTDTAGSVRVPAACCGVVGLKTTHGLISVQGVHPIEAKHLDTIGPLAKDVEGAARGMDLLQSGFASRYAAAKAAQPAARSIRIGRLRVPGTDPQIDAALDAALTKAGFHVVELDGHFLKAWEQATDDGNTMAATGAWLSDRPYLRSPWVSARSKSAILAGRINYRLGRYQRALNRRAAWQHILDRAFHKVDFIALPTLKTTPIPIGPNLKVGLLEARMLNLQNTVAFNYSGTPALAVPVPIQGEDLPASLQLAGPRLSEARLLNAGRFVEAAVKAP